MRWLSMRTLSILKYACSADSLWSNSMKAYCSESPVFLSLMTSQLRILPNLLKMSSRSSERVTGFNLQTKRIFSGGRISAKGRSPTISRVRAAADESALRRASSFSSSGRSSSISSPSPRRMAASCSGVGEGVREGTCMPSGSGNGSSVMDREGVSHAHRYCV